MRILIVGNSQDKAGGLSFYNTESKLALGFIRNGHLVHVFSAREYAKSQARFGLGKAREKAADAKFLLLANSLKPHLIVITYSCAVSSTCLADYRQKNPDVRIAQICPDILSDPKNIEKIRSRIGVADCLFCTTDGPVLDQFVSDRHRAFFIPNPVDKAIETHRAFERDDQNYDVLWAARTNVGHYAGDPRETFATKLRQASDIRLNWIGSGGADPLFGTAYYDALADAKLGLNINADHLGHGGRAATPDEIYHYSSARIAQLIGCGLLAISKRDSKLFEIFPENESMVFADTPDEVLDRVRYLITHAEERMRIARSAWETYHRDFNSDLISNYIIETTFEMPSTHAYRWV